MSVIDPFPREKTVTRTIRVNQAYDEVLKYEAERHGVSVNTLVDQVLRRYAHSYRYFDGLSAVTMSGKTVERLLSIIPEERMGEFGQALGEERPKNLLLLRGLPLDYGSVIWYLTELLGDTSNWYRATYHHREENDVLHLSHGLGHGWSLFLERYVLAFFKEVLGMTPEAQVLVNSVTFAIDASKIKKIK